MKLFNRTERRYSLACLNAAQFLGAINDNLFKLVVAFFLIDTLGVEKAPSILAAAGAIYVIPFLLFSSSAGILADRFSKQKLLMCIKAAEIGIMVFALFAFGYQSPFACYLLLFLLASHSALFGPSKYGIIPEIVPAEQVSKANGLITSFTYLAIIIGTFLASFITEISNRQFVIAAAVCLAFAVVGFASTFWIKKTPSQNEKKRFNLFFIREIYQTLSFCRTKRHLLPTIFCSSFFLFIGAYTQLNIIPFALQSLHLQEVAGGYLFLTTALGIASGSYFAGRLIRKQLDLGLSCLAGFGIGITFLLLSLFSHSLICTIILLVLVGMLGGMFIIPCDTFIQLYSPPEKRGQVIAATNFLSFCGVLLASFCLYFFSQLLSLSSAEGFALVGLVTLLGVFLLSLRLSDYFLSYISRVFLHRIRRVSLSSEAQQWFTDPSNQLLVLVGPSWKEILYLLGASPKIHLLLPADHARCIPWFHQLFLSIEILPPDTSLEDLLSFAKDCFALGGIPCYIAKADFLQEQPKVKHHLFDFFKKAPLLFVVFRKRERGGFKILALE